MELGNLVFGHSRGEYPVNRDWQDAFHEFLESCEISFYGYYEGKDEKYLTDRGGFENDVFLVNPYDWFAECTCGFEDMEIEWWERNKHTDQCFSVRIEKYEEELKKKGIRYLSDEYKKLVDKWAKDNGWEYGWEGSAFHCDCGVRKRYNEWIKDKDHTEDCRLVQPNFLYKPIGFKIMWYKYPLRDSYMNMNITYKQFLEILEACKKSLKND